MTNKKMIMSITITLFALLFILFVGIILKNQSALEKIGLTDELPDLVFVQSLIPDFMMTNSNFTINVSIKNIGNREVTDDFYISAYRLKAGLTSKTVGPGTGAFYVSKIVTGLAIGEQKEISFFLYTLEPDLLGDYELGVEIDHKCESIDVCEDKIRESNEDNNYVFRIIPMIVK